MIEGVIVTPLKQIIDDRGKVMHMLRCDSELFKAFGEIYFSVVNYNAVKAWKRHLKMTQNLTVPVGNIKLVIFDNRKDSSTHGKTEVIELGENNYSLVKIPPLLWYGFKGLSITPALIANCADLPHDPNEVERLDENSSLMPNKW